MTFPDTPDFQTSIVTAQQLIAADHGGNSTLSATVPANCESMVILLSNSSIVTLVSVVGHGSGTEYPFGAYPPQPGTADPQVYVVPVSPGVDQTYDITLSGAPGHPWNVVSDQGIRVIIDGTLASVIGKANTANNSLGIPILGVNVDADFQYPLLVGGAFLTVPVPPATDTGDHPIYELQTAVLKSITSSTAILPDPGVGMRYRLFNADIVGSVANTSSEEARIADNSFDWTPWVTGGQVAPFAWPLSGQPISVHEPLSLFISGGGTWGCRVVYTTEAV